MLESDEEIDLFALGGVSLRRKSLVLRNWKSLLNATGSGSTLVRIFGALAAQALPAERTARRRIAANFTSVNEKGTGALCQRDKEISADRHLPGKFFA